MLTLARIVKLVGGIVAAILVAGILLIVLEANRGNDIVSAVLDAARWLAGPFDNLFSLDERKTEVAVNWGLAAIVYYAIAAIIARLLARMSMAGDRDHRWRPRWRRGAHV